MRALLQRVTRASLTVDGQIVGEIGHGLLVLLGIGHGDGEAQIKTMSEKIVHLRIFEDDEGKMNRLGFIYRAIGRGTGPAPSVLPPGDATSLPPQSGGALGIGEDK